MSVYVDDMRTPLGRMVMCHMLADSTEELMAMADRIGLNRLWLQKAGTPMEHFDVSLQKRGAAVAAGAVQIGMHETGEIIRRKRDKEAPDVR